MNSTHILYSALLDVDLPEPRVSRWPFELVFFVQMDRKVVSPGEALITHMALVASYKTPLKENERTTNDIKTLYVSAS